MVKLQKPIPKKLKKNSKLDNPIKKKKQELKKSTSGATKNVKAHLIENPIEKVKVKSKSVKKSNSEVEDVELKERPQETIKPNVLEKPKKNATEKQGGKNGHTEKEKSTEKSASPTVVKDVAVTKASKTAVTNLVAETKHKKVKKNSTEQVSKKLAVKSTTKSTVNATKVADANSHSTKSKVEIGKEEVAPQKSTKTLQPPVNQPSGQVKQDTDKKKWKKESPSTSELKADKKISKLVEKKKEKLALKKLSSGEKKISKKDKKGSDKRLVKIIKETTRYEPIPFDEDRFNAIVNVENVKKVAEALKTQVAKEVTAKKSSIFDDYRYFLDVGSFKIANCPKRMVKLNLKHPLVAEDDDVLLVVPDLRRGAKVDYEPTIHHYEDMLRFYGVTRNIKVMPMNQLRKEYGTFEQKRRICASYEHFLCDGRIVSHVVGIVGKTAQKPRTTFHAVRFNKESEIKNEIEKALRRTAFRQLAKSSLHSIPVGSHKFTSAQLADNVQIVVAQLKKLFPGGLGNIRNLHLKIDITGTSSLPLYMSMAQAPDETPSIMGPREQRMIKLKRDANEVLSKFAMTKEGKLIKLTKPDVEKKRKLLQMRAILKEEEEEAKKSKKAKKDTSDKDNKGGVKELELPENENDDTTDEDDDVVQIGSDDDEDHDDMGQFDNDDDDEGSLGAESETEIVENGLVDESGEESNAGQDDTDESEEEDDEDDNDDDDSEEEEETD